MDGACKCKTYNYKPSKRELRKKIFCNIGLWKNSEDITQKPQSIKGQIDILNFIKIFKKSLHWVLL